MTNDILRRLKYHAVNAPETLACSFGEVGITYSCFDKETDTLAEAIQILTGKKRQLPIIIYMKRGIRFVEMMIAVMKCQCFYIPAEDNLPVDRIKYIYKDVGAALIITDNVAMFEEENVCDYEALMKIDAHSGGSFYDYPIYEDDLVYAMYTSGTTGCPKGVKIKYSNLLNLMNSFYDIVYKNFSTPVSVGLIAAFSFDSSVKQIYGALFYGHNLCIAKSSDKFMARKLHSFHIKNDLKLCDATPSHLRLMSMKKIEKMSSIPFLLLGGEMLTWEALKDYEDCVGWQETTFINVYGPTECCVDVAYKVITKEEIKNHTGAVPVGKPVRNTRLILLNEEGNEVTGFYKEGELCILGEQVGAGYINAKSSAFINYKGEIMYKTGDLAYLNEEDDYVIRGRKDSQVKINGYRVELGEIQNVLKKIAGSECAVFCEKDSFGNNKKLAAFICKNSVTASEIDRYREELAKILPAYMIPHYFINGESIPLNINGKTDEKALQTILEKQIEMAG